jgi:6-phosphogluconolactonase
MYTKTGTFVKHQRTMRVVFVDAVSSWDDARMGTSDRQSEIVVCATADALAEEAADRVIASAQVAVAAREQFSFVLSGGSTPEKTYSRLATPEKHAAINWEQTWFFFGDERCVPHDDPRSNYRLAAKALFEPAKFDLEQILAVPTDVGTPAECAAKYETMLKAFFKRGVGSATSGSNSSDGLPQFDLILLGLGDDGHTASLFPGKPALQEAKAWVTWSPPGVLPPPVDRVTFTYPLINAAREVMFLVAGAAKAVVVREVLERGAEVAVHPASGVRPANGKLTWLLDEAAASLLADRRVKSFPSGAGAGTKPIET